MNIFIEFCVFKLVSVPKFRLKLIILIFWTKFAEKRHFQSKTEKLNTIEFCMFKLVKELSFSLNGQFWFLDLISPKKVIPVENGKTEHPHWLLHIWISLELAWQFWYFRRNLPKKSISGRKKKKWAAPLNSACSNWSRF